MAVSILNTGRKGRRDLDTWSHNRSQSIKCCRESSQQSPSSASPQLAVFRYLESFTRFLHIILYACMLLFRHLNFKSAFAV